MPRYPDGRFVLTELADYRDEGYSVTLYCQCGRTSRLDMVALARLYGDHALFADVFPRLTCRACGARGRPAVRMILGSPSSYDRWLTKQH